MADVGFTGYPLCSSYWDTPESADIHGNYFFNGIVILNQKSLVKVPILVNI